MGNREEIYNHMDLSKVGRWKRWEFRFNVMGKFPQWILHIITWILLVVNTQAQTFDFVCVTGNNWHEQFVINNEDNTNSCLYITPAGYCIQTEITLGEDIAIYIKGVRASRFGWARSYYCVDGDPSQGRCNDVIDDYEEFDDHDISNPFIITPTEAGFFSININSYLHDGTNIYTSRLVRVLPIPITLTCDNIPGDYTLEMDDFYGDGWQGSHIILNIDEVITNYGMPSPYASDSLRNSILERFTGDTSKGYSNFTIPTGTTSVSISFIGGDWPDEIAFRLKKADTLTNVKYDFVPHNSVPDGLLLELNCIN